MRGKRDIQLEARWREIVSGHPCSGQTVRAYFKARQLTEASCFFWLRELLRRAHPLAVRPQLFPIRILPYSLQHLCAMDREQDRVRCGYRVDWGVIRRGYVRGGDCPQLPLRRCERPHVGWFSAFHFQRYLPGEPARDGHPGRW